MIEVRKVLYRTGATSTDGGRDGRAVSTDGALDVALATPRELGGPGGEGTNPEQLFAAGYAACFLGSVRYLANRDGIALPADTAVTAEVALGMVPTGFGLAVTLRVAAPGLDRDVLGTLVEGAHAVCPYSNATRGNIRVDLAIA